MGSYKWSYKSLLWVISIVTLLLIPLITTCEPPSKCWFMRLGGIPSGPMGFRGVCTGYNVCAEVQLPSLL